MEKKVIKLQDLGTKETNTEDTGMEGMEMNEIVERLKTEKEDWGQHYSALGYLNGSEWAQSANYGVLLFARYLHAEDISPTFNPEPDNSPHSILNDYLWNTFMKDDLLVHSFYLKYCWLEGWTSAIDTFYDEIKEELKMFEDDAPPEDLLGGPVMN